MSTRTLYVFLDESGNLDFSSKGTAHFVVAAVYTFRPDATAAPMQELKYKLMAQRSTDLEFHAAVNSRGTRKRVTETIRTVSPLLAVKTLYVDKRFAHPKRQSAVGMMEIFGTAIARWLVSEGGPPEQYDQIVLVFDSVLTGKQRDAFMKVVKPKLKMLRKPFHVLFHPVKSDLNGQIADYFAWSAFRQLEHQDQGPMRELLPSQPHMFDLFARGKTRFY